MSILGVIVRGHPERGGALRDRLARRPGIDLALDPGDGRYVLVLEDTEAGGAAATLGEIALWPEVINTSLVYEYSGPDSPAPGAPGANYTDWRNSLRTAAQPPSTGPAA